MLAVRSVSSLAPEASLLFPLQGEAPSFACSVVVPFFNEATGAFRFLEELAAVVESLSDPAEVLLIDDGSTDGTTQVLEGYVCRHPNFRLIRQPHNQGQAAALLRGMQLAAAPVIITLDGDGQ